jgi:hypothetical protein
MVMIKALARASGLCWDFLPVRLPKFVASFRVSKYSCNMALDQPLSSTGDRMTATTDTNRRKIRRWWVVAALVSLGLIAAGAFGSAGWISRTGAVGESDNSVRGAGIEPLLDRSTAAETAPARQRDPQAVWEALNQPAQIEQRLLDDVRYLASDELEGRGIGTLGIELAADYIGDEFERAGLETRLFDGEPFQRFSQSRRLGMNGPNHAQLTAPDGRAVTWTLKDEFTPLSISSGGSLDLPLVFVGYGITAPEIDYDDYAGVDVVGKAVIVLRHEPRRQIAADPSGAGKPSNHAYLTRKITNAVEQGAAAVLFCTDANSLRTAAGGGSGDVPVRDDELSDHDRLLDFRVHVRDFPRQVPVLHVRRAAVQAMIRQAGAMELADIERRIDEQQKPSSLDLPGWRLTGEVHVGVVSQPLRNVIAVHEGEGAAADETIVIGAHYDHLGYGGGWGSLAPWTREIHNGADDNASGTAVVIELARLLASRPEPYRRRLMFIAFTAEESGLIGSEYYIANPLVPMDQTVAMLNFDMVGYLRNERLELDGTGTAAEFDPLLYKLGMVHGFRLVMKPDGYGPSDHATFRGAGVPVLHFFTGLHDYYHRPSDDTERLNFDGMRRITEFGRDLVTALADSPTRPQPQTSGGLDLFAGLSAEGISRSSTGPAPWGLEGRMDSSGYVATSLSAWGAAAKSGIRAGDRLLQIGTKRIESEADYQEAITQFRRGTTVPVILQRGRFELEVDIGG